MGDNNGISVSDLLGLSQPLSKLIETVGHGIGVFYEPIHVRRMANAKADEIKIICEAASGNIGMPVLYQAGEITVDTTDANNLLIRTNNRAVFQELKKQQNIEAVIGNAVRELADKTMVSDEPVDNDWVTSFFDFVANISNEQMQIIWGKLLSGEIEKPGSFSIRTLDTLRKMTQYEANLFKKVAPFLWHCPASSRVNQEDYFLISEAYSGTKILEKCGIDFMSIMELDEAGLLLSDGSTICITLEIEANETDRLYGLNDIILIKNLDEQQMKLSCPAYILTATGKELYDVIIDEKDSVPEWYSKECARVLDNHLYIEPSNCKYYIQVL